jgi:hypothetical protein
MNKECMKTNTLKAIETIGVSPALLLALNLALFSRHLKAQEGCNGAVQ